VTFSSCSKKNWGAQNSLLASEKSTNGCFSVNCAEFTSTSHKSKQNERFERLKRLFGQVDDTPGAYKHARVFTIGPSARASDSD